jgi:hypothetical protein
MLWAGIVVDDAGPTNRIHPNGARPTLNPHLRRSGLSLAALFGLLAGCAPRGPTLTPQELAIERAARPILTLDQDAVWTDCFNRLVERGPEAVAYLVEAPLMCRPCAPDDLRVMLHCSLLHLLIQPGLRPRLTANCLETALDVLHFDLKVNGHRIGTPCLSERRLPRYWHELYPADCDLLLGDGIDADADRTALRRWWQEHGRSAQGLVAGQRLTPRPADLWPWLSRSYADRWLYSEQSRTLRCAAGPDQALFSSQSYDYNLVRAACLWLGAAEQAEIRDRLIGLVASPSAIVAYNARFALRHAADARIRELLQRYKDPEDEPRRQPAPADRDAPPEITWLPAETRCVRR